MPWSFSFQLMPGESVLEDTSLTDRDLVKAVYSVYLTDRRVIFRFNGLGSNLCKSFLYREILDARPTTRLLVGYLVVRTFLKEELFNVHNAAYLAGRILKQKEQAETKAPEPSLDTESFALKRKMLLDMLVTLRKNGLLTEEEYNAKASRLDSLKF